MAVFEGLEFTGMVGGTGPVFASYSGPVSGAVAIRPAAVPEPSSLAAWGLVALVALCRLRRRRS
jgi:MYXO-CTERM domain-containing protein